MDQFHVYAYESLGWWHITGTWRSIDVAGESRETTLYRGTHVPIDDEDPEVRAVLLLHQLHSDLERAISGERVTLIDGPEHH